MEMLDGVSELTLEFLNEVTQAWLEIEYNRRPHREIGCSPVERFAQARDVLRPSPSSEALRDAFRMEVSRTQRQSDGRSPWTACGSRSPGVIATSARSRCGTPAGTSAASIWSTHTAEPFSRPCIRWIARPTPTASDCCSNATPRDDRREATGRPGRSGTAEVRVSAGREATAAALKRILDEYSAKGLPPAYLPKNPPSNQGETP